MSTVHPTMINATDGLAAAPPDQGTDSWWFGARLLDDDENVVWAQIHTTITAEGSTHGVSGRTWFDRQWGSGSTEPPRFLWLGLDLGEGRYPERLGHRGRRYFLTHCAERRRLTPDHPRSANRPQRTVDLDHPQP